MSPPRGGPASGFQAPFCFRQPAGAAAAGRRNGLCPGETCLGPAVPFGELWWSWLTSGLEEQWAMLVLNPPPPQVVGDGAEREGNSEGPCPALPQLIGQVQKAPAPALAPQHPAHPMGCGCCDPWEPPAPPGLRDMLHGQDRGVGMEGLGAT